MTTEIATTDRNGSLPTVLPPGPAAQLANLLPQLPELANALVKAQAACGPVEHDAYNAHHKYDYTSAEAVIGEGKRALGAAGLALLPLRQSVNGWERPGKAEERFELERHFVLMHVSGQMAPIVVYWPVVPQTGRPLDKATAAAATLSLSYFLRDLLLMPRVDPDDDVSGRDDSEHKPAQKPQAQPPEGQELQRRLYAYDAKLASQGLCQQGDLVKHVVMAGIKAGYDPDLSGWKGPAAVLAVEETKSFEAQRRKVKEARPKSPVELSQRIYALDAKLASEGVCEPGDLVKHVTQAGVKKGLQRVIAEWIAPEAVDLAIAEVKAFMEARQKPAAEAPAEDDEGGLADEEEEIPI